MVSKRSPVGIKSGADASKLIDARIEEFDDWRGETLARVRKLIRQADPGIVEEWKWNIPVWSLDGIITTGEVYKGAVKLTFAHGAHLPDPSKLFNSSLDGATRRAIDIRQGDRLDERAFKTLVKAAVALNRESRKSSAKRSNNATGKSAAKSSASKRAKAKLPVSDTGVVLLSGGNPQIAAAEGDAPVHEYIRAMPGWKRKVGEELDALIERTIPKLQKAVKWNSPFYGVEGKGYFLSYHVFAKYVKVTFFRGADLDPVPPEPSKDPHARYAHIHEDDELDTARWTKWIKQAAKLPGYLAPGS